MLRCGCRPRASSPQEPSTWPCVMAVAVPVAVDLWHCAGHCAGHLVSFLHGSSFPSVLGVFLSHFFNNVHCVSWFEIPVSWTLDLLHRSCPWVVQFSRLFPPTFTPLFLCFTFWKICLSSSIPPNAFLNFCYYISILKSFNTSF